MSEAKNKASDFGVTKEEFAQWRSPREGTSNPTRMDNAVWKWLIATKIDAFRAADQMQADSTTHGNPTWCFSRYGQSSTEMPDGRIIYIGGEHEDYYDPDFYIYNDVVVVDPMGEVSIFGYPMSVFPSTDFHSATLVGAHIYVIGNLGYPHQRKPVIDTVYELDTESYAFTAVATTGESPTWIHSHKAELSSAGDSIIVFGGLMDRGGKKGLAENLSTWELNLSTLVWKHLYRHAWKRWQFCRSDSKTNILWDIRQALWTKSVGWKEDHQKDMDTISARAGRVVNIEAIHELYRPILQHTFTDADDGERHNVYRIEIDGVTIRYVESMFDVQMTVEGPLSNSLSESLAQDVCRKLSELEGIEYRMEEID